MLSLIGFIGGGIFLLSLLSCAFLVKRFNTNKDESYTKFAFSRLASHPETRPLSIMLFTIAAIGEALFFYYTNQQLNLTLVFLILEVIALLSMPLLAITAINYNSLLHLSSAFVFYFSELILFLLISFRLLELRINLGIIEITILAIGVIISAIKILRRPWKISGAEEILAFTFIGICILIYMLSIIL